MDFLDPKKRRRHELQLIVGYVLVGIAIFLSTLVLIYYANGFGVSRDGSLEQRGLVFVSSQPSGSDVYVNGKKKTTTNAKLNLATGTYNLGIKRTGYHNWSRNILVEGSSVDHYIYPLLIPKELTATSLATVTAQPILTTQSPDKHWILTQTTAGDSFALYNTQKSQTEIGTPEEIAIPPRLLSVTSEPATWSVVEWAANSRHVLLLRTYTTASGKQSEYILLDRQRLEGSHNLTQELTLAADMQLSLRDKQPDIYYAYQAASSTLNAVSLDAPTPVVVQRDVLGFKSYGTDILLYASSDNAADNEARIILRDEKKSYYIRTVPRSDTYLLDLTRYDKDWFVAAGAPSDGRVFLYENPITSIAAHPDNRPIPVFVFKLNAPTNIAFSANAQFLAVQNGSEVYVYDAEFVRAYKYTAPRPIEGPLPYATWLDAYHLTYVTGGKQYVIDYDGINGRPLTAVTPSIGGFFDRDVKYLYTFATPEGVAEPALLSTALRTPEDQ